MEKSIFWKFGVYFPWKMCKDRSIETFSILNREISNSLIVGNRCHKILVSLVYQGILGWYGKVDFLKIWTIKINNISIKKCEKPSIETFFKKIAKSNFLRKINVVQCCIFVISRIFDKISFLKLWTIKKIIKKWTKKSKDAHKFLNFYPKILIVWLLERA